MKKLLALSALALASYLPFSAQAAYPERQVRWVVPYAAGGGSDFLARTIAQGWMGQAGQTILVENKPGGNTAIAAADIARSAPDGYAVMSADNGTMVFNPALYSKLTYNPETDLAPVTLMGRFPMILVAGPAVPEQDAKALLKRLQESGTHIDFASAGAGSPHHLAMELLKVKAGLDMVHVPYRGAAPALQDVAGGQIPIMMVDMAAGASYLQGDRVRPLAVAHHERLPQLPNVPTFAELGLADVEASALVGLVAPAKTPADVIETISQQVNNALQQDTVRTKLIEFGVEPVGTSPADYAALLEKENQRWRTLIRELNITLD